jgi:hypothetical protein
MSKTAKEIIKNMDGDKLFSDLNDISDYYDRQRKEMVAEYKTILAGPPLNASERRKLKEERNKAFLELDNMQKRIAKAKVGIEQKERKFLEFTEPEMQDILYLLEEHKAREPKTGGGNVGSQMRKVFANGGVQNISPEEIEERKKMSDKFQDIADIRFLIISNIPKSQIKESYNNPEILKNYPSVYSRYQLNKELFNEGHNSYIKDMEEDERQPKQKGGDVDMQMSELMPLETEQQDMVPEMETEQQDMVSDMEMEEDYLDFILDEALTDEEEVMLETKLEQDEELAMIFDKVVDVAQEFAGAGLVEGPGNGVSDSIPARLSDGEFVFTAKAAKEIGTDTLMSVMKEAEARADARQGMANGGVSREEVKPSPVFGTKVDESTIPSEINEGMVATNPLDPRHRYFQ